MIRTAVMYFAIIFAMRVLGKRQVGELEPSELAVTILISELAAIPLQNRMEPLAAGLVPILVLLFLGVITSYAAMKLPWARILFHGRPSIIIKDGNFVQSEIRRLRINIDEISEELRRQNICGVEGIRYGIIETGGQLSVIRNDGDSPVTRKDLNITAPPVDPLPRLLISGGRLLPKNVRAAGLDRGQILEILRSRGIKRIGKVFYMSRDSDGRFKIVPKTDGK